MPRSTSPSIPTSTREEVSSETWASAKSLRGDLCRNLSLGRGPGRPSKQTNKTIGPTLQKKRKNKNKFLFIPVLATVFFGCSLMVCLFVWIGSWGPVLGTGSGRGIPLRDFADAKLPGEALPCGTSTEVRGGKERGGGKRQRSHHTWHSVRTSSEGFPGRGRGGRVRGFPSSPLPVLP